MAHSESDRNLLFGVLALQMDFITRDALIAAMNGWVLEKDKSLGELLEERGALAPADRALLEPLVNRHIEQHGGNPAHSLASLSSVDWIRGAMGPASQADADLQQSLNRLPTTKPESSADPYATVSHIGPPGAAGSRFRIVRFHARGGLGEVYVAQDTELHREVALKQIQDRHGDHAESRTRFLLEAEITGGLEHPGIVPVYGLGHYPDGRPFYAMRFIKGDSLKKAIEDFHRAGSGSGKPGERMLELQKLLRRFLDVCNAVAYAHSRGVLHRDLKPGNIMVGHFGETLVVDWGLAKVVGRSETSGDATLRPPSASGSSVTLPGSAMGTPAFMSPEQAAGRLDQLGPASDVYSLGATLYCLLTGKPPIDAEVEDAPRRIQEGDIRPPRQVKPDVPRPLDAICLKAMALKPEDRYGSPRGLAEDIERWLADEPVSAYSEPWMTRLARQARRHRTLVTSVGAAAVVAAVCFGVATAMLAAANNRERRQAELARRNGNEARANFRLAFDGVDRYFTQVSEDRLLNVPGLQPVRRQLLDAAREFYQKFLDDRQDDLSVRAELGRAYLRLARITFDTGASAKAVELARQGLAIL
ncbi:MAG: protein kinase domain-containing protein [Isosphaeraceae bacterium]